MSKFPGFVLKRATESLPRRTYRIPEVQQVLGIGRSKVYDLLKTGVLERVEGIEGITLIKVDSVERLLDGDAA